jgi:hypothetical protein
MTPSTFSIGTILNTNILRAVTADGELPSSFAIVPCITHEELLSPGCTRALRKIISLVWKQKYYC